MLPSPVWISTILKTIVGSFLGTVAGIVAGTATGILYVSVVPASGASCDGAGFAVVGIAFIGGCIGFVAGGTAALSREVR